MPGLHPAASCCIAMADGIWEVCEQRGGDVMKIAIGCDEAAYSLKVEIMEHLKKRKRSNTKILGRHKEKWCFYPDIAYAVADAVAAGNMKEESWCAALGLAWQFAPIKSSGYPGSSLPRSIFRGTLQEKQ